MAEQDTLPDKDKPKKQEKKHKFLFDNYNFDEGPVSLEPEPEEPPPPMFSEEELSRTGRDSYQKGFNEGKHESDTGRERHVADLIEKIAAQFATLFAAEEDRATRYENEAVHLCSAVFKTAFPSLNESRGMDELTKIIHNVLETHRDVPEIVIEVDPDMVDDIEKKLKNLMNSEGFAGNYSVKGNTNCRAGDCKMRWKDGGVERNAQYLAEKISEQLEDALADKPLLHNNKEKDTTNRETDDPSPSAEPSPPTDQEMEHKE